VATFIVVSHRYGPQWDPSRPMEEQSNWPAHASFMDGLVDAGFVVLGGPLADEHRGVLVVETESGTRRRDRIGGRRPRRARARSVERDHLRVDTIDPWTIRLDGRRA